MIEIEVLPSELQAANFVARNAEIVSINLRRSVFQIIKEATPQVADNLQDVGFQLRWKTEPHSAPQAGRLIAVAGILVEIKPPATKKAEVAGGKSIAVVELLYEVHYSVPLAPLPKNIANVNGIEAFCRWNALYNCWPFFREDVRRICAQAGLPPLTIPLLKLCAKGNPTRESKLPEAAES